MNSTRTYCSSATCRFKQRSCFQLRLTRGNRDEQLLLRQPYMAPRPLPRLGDLSAEPRASHRLSLNCAVVQLEIVNTTHNAHFPHSCSAGLSPQTAGLPRLATSRPSIPQPIVLASWTLTAFKYNRVRPPATKISISLTICSVRPGTAHQDSVTGEIDRNHAP